MLSAFSCTSKQKEQLTKQEEEQIKNEIIATEDSITSFCKNFDKNRNFLQIYSNENQKVINLYD
jgi:hypothetical protein